MYLGGSEKNQSKLQPALAGILFFTKVLPKAK
jgi:hypothetical protein